MSKHRAVAQLLVRNLEPEVVARLRRRAAEHGRSVEAEHREILRSALKAGAGQPSFKQALLQMPDAGTDADFERVHQRPRAVRL